MTDIDLFEVIYTARSLRRLKPDPVPEKLITRLLDAAIRAPSAGNAQNWAFVVVREPSVRRALGDIYQRASRIADAMYAARGRPPHLTEQQFRRMMTTGTYLWAHMGDAPVILVPCPSLYPAVQNILLACRALGLGTTITTNHIRIEGEVKAVLGLPDDVDTFAMMPIGWPIDPFGPLTRRPVAEVACADRWGEPWPAEELSR
jgi:nitroreductase